MKFYGLILVTFLFASLSSESKKHLSRDRQLSIEDQVAESPVTAATSYLASLSDLLRTKTRFSVSDSERLDWNYIPMPRKGVPLGMLSKTQIEKAFSLLRASYSLRGYTKVREIITRLEPMLVILENRKPDDHYRDSGKYYVSLFGEPGLEKVWGWRLEGHHVSCNFLFRGNTVISATPAFLGSNPAKIPIGTHKGEEVLHNSISEGFMLVRSLSEEQLKKARLKTGFSSSEINSIQGHSLKPKRIEPAGISLAGLDTKQQALFWSLIDAYTENFTPETAKKMLNRLHGESPEHLSFYWQGGLKQGELYYYRIQGANYIIEHDNTQNDGNHVHSVIRDFKGDFGNI